MRATTKAEDAADVLAETARRIPTTGLMTGIAPESGTGENVPGAQLADTDWLSEQVGRVARRWGTGDLRVAGTLWWYSASTVVLAPPLASGLLTGTPVHPGPQGVTLHPEPGGRLLAVRPQPGQPVLDQAGLAPPLRELLRTITGNLAEVTGMRPRPLWALATDSLANVLLRAGRESGRLQQATDWAGELAEAVGTPLPRPRWTDVPVPDGSDGLFPVPPEQAADTERFVRRGSCCLIYKTGGEGKCASCPRRTPGDRHLRLEIAASRLAGSG